MPRKATQPDTIDSAQGYDQILDEHDHIITSTVAWAKWHFNKQTREDVAQRIRSQLVQSDIHEKPPEKIASCVRRLAISRCIDELRKLIRRGQTFVQVESDLDTFHPSSSPASSGVNPVLEVMADEERSSLMEAVKSVGEPCGSRIAAHYINGLSYKEIATESGVSIKTVGTRLFRCMEKLKALVKENPHLMEDLQKSVRT